MAIRVGRVAIAAALIVALASAAFVAYAADTVARAERWTARLGFVPGDPGSVDRDCGMLSKDSFDPPKRSYLKFRAPVDAFILTTVHQKRYCSSYYRFRLSEEGQAALRRVWNVNPSS